MSVILLPELDSYLFACPHCAMMIMVGRGEINCRIFRHGQFKDSGRQLDPHSPKEYCDMVVSRCMIWGCGKPFTMSAEGVEKCDYI